MRTRTLCPIWPETEIEWFALVLAGFQSRSKALTHKLNRIKASIEADGDNSKLVITGTFLSTSVALTLWSDRVGSFQAFRGSKNGWLFHLQVDVGPCSSDGVDLVELFEASLSSLEDEETLKRIWATTKNQGEQVVARQPAISSAITIQPPSQSRRWADI